MNIDSALSWLKSTWEENQPPRWVLVALPLTYAIYKFLTWQHGVFRRIGVRGPRPWPVLGTMIPFMRLGLLDHDIEMKRLYGPVVGTFFGPQPAMIIYDLDILKAILVKDFAKFQNRLAATLPDYPLSKMLTMLQDDHWKHVRNTLTPTFSSGKLRKMQQQIEKCAGTLLENLQQKADADETFEFREYCGAYTMDVIASTAFGLQIDSHNDPNNQFVRMSKRAFEFNFASIKTIMFFFFPFLIKPFSKLGYRIFPREVTDFFVKTVDKVIAERRSESHDKTKVDFLQLMVNAEENHDQEADDEDVAAAADSSSLKTGSDWKQRGLTHEEVLAQGIMFLMVGYETTATTLAFLAYLLAVNSDCQDKLIAEIDDVMQGQEHVTLDIVNKMPYLDMCVSETLRLYPAGPRTDRVASEDMTINGVFIPKGMLIGIPIMALHYDTDYWQQPDRFDPDRFLPEAKAARNPYCYIPFGVGPRNCIGMRLALVEMKIAIVSILRKFNIVVSSETQIPLKLEKIRVRGTEGIKLKVKQRAARH